MSWYSTGTVTVTNGSAVVTGSGTSWVGTIDAGWGFVAPDGKVYEVLSVDSATQITLAKNYAGSNASGQPYSLFPTQGLVRALTTQVLQLINDYAAVATGAGAGKFSAGTAALPGVAASTDLDTGIAWLAANALGVSTGGVERMRVNSTGVGINESAPLSRLHIGGGGELITMERASDNQPFLQIGSPAGTSALSLKNIGGLTSELFIDSGTVSVQTNGTERVRVDNAALTFSGDLVYSKTELRINPNTSDGADTSRLVMLGGGGWSVNRGAQLVLTGNEHADAGGWILGAGTNGAGQINAGGGVTLNGGTPGVTFGSTAIHLAHSAAPTLAATRQMAFTLTSNTNLRISVRGTDGVTRVANLTLA